MNRPAIFLDRDGVVIRDVDLMTRVDQVELLPGAAPAIARIQGAGYAAVVVTNQSVVARGMCSEADVDAVHCEIDRRLIAAGARKIDEYRFCPHHPDADVVRYRVMCECRKPRPGMLREAAAALGLDLAASVMIGDRPTDVLAGHRAGCRTVLVGTNEAPLIAGVDPAELVPPDHRAADLGAAIDWVLRGRE